MADKKISQLPDGGDAAEGDVFVAVRGGSTLKITVPDPKLILQTMFTDVGNLSPGSYLKLGEVDSGVTGWKIPANGSLIKVVIGRADVDPADIEILVNGVVTETIASTSNTVIEALSTEVVEGDDVSVRSKVGSSTMSNTIVTVIFERT